MTNVLQHQHQNTASAYDIMYSLKEMFGDQDRAARQVAMKQLFNTSMHEGTPVKDHILKMMNILNELEILGANIDGESQVDIILQSLLESFGNFCLNYNINKRSHSLAELLKELQMEEGLFMTHPKANVA